MPSKPSRSEIEASVAGRNKPSRRRRPAPAETLEQVTVSATARHRKVIGGDLTGISKRPGRDRRNRSYRQINAVNWIAGAIVVLIIAVFFWPHPSDDSIKEVKIAEPIQSAAAYSNESRVDQQSSSQKERSFTRDTDLARAKLFRQQEKQENRIGKLLEDAKAHIQKREYSLPKRKNAVLSYKKILKIDPNNSGARRGISNINNIYLKKGYQELAANKQRSAKTTLEKLRLINDQSDEFLEFEQAYAGWQKNHQINKLIANSNQAVEDDKLIQPERQNALYYYQQILLLDDQNDAALRGIQTIANIYINKANSAALDGRYVAAKGFLTTVSVIDPNNPSIALIEGLIDKPSPPTRELANSSLRPAQSEPSSRGRTAPRPATQKQAVLSNNRTPSKEAREQETFDRQYLQRGLDAYYQGDHATAIALLQPLADKGVSRAQFRIAYMHYLGRGFDRDKKEADRIIRAALPAIRNFAEQGRDWAQSDLGSLYEDGLVLPKDFAEAVYWYRSAAEKGYPGAQTNLGIMYARGRGVNSNRRTAIEWFQRAAKQGDISAKRNLEAMGVAP